MLGPFPAAARASALVVLSLVRGTSLTGVALERPVAGTAL